VLRKSLVGRDNTHLSLIISPEKVGGLEWRAIGFRKSHLYEGIREGSVCDLGVKLEIDNFTSIIAVQLEILDVLR